MACYLPPYLEENSLYAEGPVTCICASYFEGDCLTHRDFLGEPYGGRDQAGDGGDICVGKGSCDFFLLREMAPLWVQNLPSAGRTRLHLEEIPLEEAQIPHSGDGDHPGNPGLLPFGQRYWGRLPPEPDPGGGAGAVRRGGGGRLALPEAGPAGGSWGCNFPPGNGENPAG